MYNIDHTSRASVGRVSGLKIPINVDSDRWLDLQLWLWALAELRVTTYDTDRSLCQVIFRESASTHTNTTDHPTEPPVIKNL